jgi:hypothetical protein
MVEYLILKETRNMSQAMKYKRTEKNKKSLMIKENRMEKEAKLRKKHL